MLKECKEELDALAELAHNFLPIDKPVPVELILKKRKTSSFSFFRKKNPDNRPALSELLSNVKTHIATIQSIVAKENPEVEEYRQLLSAHGKLVSTYLSIKKVYNKQILACTTQPSKDFRGFALGLAGLHQYVTVILKKRKDLYTITDAEEKRNNEVAFKDFLQSMPKNFDEIKEELARIFSGKKNASTYIRALTIITKCEVCYKEVDKLLKDIDNKYASRSSVEDYRVPEGILWHPEVYRGDPILARTMLINIVVSYVKYFKLAQEHKKLHQFFNAHDDNGCFEKSVEILSDWVIKRKLISNSDNQLIENKTPLQSLEDVIHHNHHLTNEDLLSIPGFTELLYEFCMPQYTLMTLEEQSTNELPTILTSKIDDKHLLKPRIQHLIYLYCLELGMIDSEEKANNDAAGVGTYVHAV